MGSKSNRAVNYGGGWGGTPPHPGVVNPHGDLSPPIPKFFCTPPRRLLSPPLTQNFARASRLFSTFQPVFPYIMNGYLDWEVNNHDWVVTWVKYRSYWKLFRIFLITLKRSRESRANPPTSDTCPPLRSPPPMGGDLSPPTPKSLLTALFSEVKSNIA